MTDYEKLYGEGRHVCGAPFPEVISFFSELQGPQGILDLGCGQGRDALPIARLGHRVLGVDISPTGVAQMLEDASKEDLPVEGAVADLAAYKPSRQFDAVLLDRVLHMFKQPEVARSVLDTAMRATKPGGHLLMADLPSNRTWILGSLEGPAWHLVKSTKNYTFARRETG